MKLLSILSLVIAAGCSPYEPELGNIPFRCGEEEGEQQCPDGYRCVEEGQDKLCVKNGFELEPDAALAFQCNSDSLVEPNEIGEDAFDTGIAKIHSRLRLPNLAICPAQDVDYYRIDVTEDSASLFTTLRFNSEIGNLVIQVKDSEGKLLREGIAPPGQRDVREAQVAALGPGSYYAIVFSEDGIARNNYTIEMELK